MKSLFQEHNFNVANTLRVLNSMKEKNGGSVFNVQAKTGTAQLVHNQFLQSGQATEDYKNAVATANKNVDTEFAAFKDALLHPENKLHSQTRRSFVQDFGSSEAAVYNSIKTKIYNLLQIGTGHVKNTAYEQRMTSPAALGISVIQTDRDAWYVENWKNLFNAHIDVYGYDGVDDLLSEYKLTNPRV